MTLIAIVPALCALIGLGIYALTSHKNLGLVVLLCGLLVTMNVVSGHVVHL